MSQFATENQVKYLRSLLYECFGGMSDKVMKFSLEVDTLYALSKEDASLIISKLVKETRDEGYVSKLMEKMHEAMGQLKLF